MKYILALAATLILVLLFVPAPVQAQCAEDYLFVGSDYDLPAYGDTIEVDTRECEKFSWEITFTRTSQNGENNVVFFCIEALGVEREIESEDYTMGTYTYKGKDWIDDEAVEIFSVITISDTTNCGNFANLSIWYSDD
jgi:hypothetical protein